MSDRAIRKDAGPPLDEREGDGVNWELIQWCLLIAVTLSYFFGEDKS